MHWPTESVERVRPSRFKPPFCPWPDCPAHHATPARFHRHGSFSRRGDPSRVPRFRCLLCGRTCSRQTFSVTYYLKRPALPPSVAAGLEAGSAHRQIARSLSCAKTTVTRLAARLGRHAILLQARALAEIGALEEPVVYDHFETFTFCQEFALGVGTAVGARSWFIYALDAVSHRRGGPSTPRRDAHRARFGRPEPTGGYERAARQTLDLLSTKAPGPCRLRLVTDGHDAYLRAVARHPARSRVDHATYPNPKRGPKGAPRSPEAVVRDAAMRPVDALHQLIRHTSADHARETLAFARRAAAVMERMFLTAVWRNFVKGRSERRPDRTTPAMRLGLTDRPWTWSRVLAKRLFPGRERVPSPWMVFYRRLWITPAIGRNRRHDLANAF